MPGNGTILIAEDDPNDAFFLETALGEIGVQQPFCFVRNGEEAIHFLAGEGSYADRATFPAPALLLLDLKMPRKDGFEVLRWLQRHPEVKSQLKVVVISSLRRSREVNLARKLGADSFLEKPLGFFDFQEMVRQIIAQWLGSQSPGAAPEE